MMSVHVRRGNKMLTIAEDAVQRYLNEGYDVVDERGAVITKAVPRDTTTLTAEYERLTAENAKLKELIDSLKTDIISLKASLEAKPKKSEKGATTDESAEITPKRQRKPKSETVEE